MRNENGGRAIERAFARPSALPTLQDFHESLTLVNEVTVSSDLSFNPRVTHFTRRAHLYGRAHTDLSDSGTDQRTLHDQCRRGGGDRYHRRAAGRTAATAFAGRACGDQSEGA